MEASVLDLRTKMHEVMDAIMRHEHITLTYRGRRCATIVPTAVKAPIKVTSLPAYGMWADRDDMAEPVTFVKNMRKSRGIQ